MKGTQEKLDMLTSKSQEPGQDGLTYVKMCQRREMQLHAGTAVTDDTLRRFIEDCVNHLRITIFKTRVSEQLRVQRFPPPSKVTWKDLEGIVEVQDKLKNDAESWILSFLQELARRSGCKYSCWEAQHHGLDLRAIKATLKKHNSEAMELSESADANKQAGTPSPSKKIKKEVNNAERLKKPYSKAEVPAGFHEKMLDSEKRWQSENAAMRMYNLRNNFKNSDWGILVNDWVKLPKAEKDTYRMNQTAGEKKATTEKAASLAAEYQGMLAQSQVLSEDEGSDEEFVAQAADREVYRSDVHEVNCLEVSVPEHSAAAGSTAGAVSTAGVETGALVAEIGTHRVRGHAEAQATQEETEVVAAPAVALGCTQRMRGFPVKTPEKFEAEAQVPHANAASVLERKVQLLSSLLKSTRTAFSKIVATLVAEGRVTAPRDVDALVELADAGQLPMPVASVADREEVNMYPDYDSDGEDELSGLDCVRGRVYAGTMEAEAYDLLKDRMLSGLTEEQLTTMAQVQPVCKLLSDALATGLALLGLNIFDAETGAKVTRCDGSPAEFTKYCYVDVILAAGTPHMTLHRLHAFVTFTENTTWDFLIGTGPLKSALKLTIDLYRDIARSEAAVSLGMKEKVTLPLIELAPPADARCVPGGTA
ncbi:hypothetical protein CYMTET_54790 [Cymbomonas tetramitiformis]|uniref:Uncharacterized protein n=1 Tax=Cymbomonas tetramitiformis TaxID=36881 RepID=A0AAE0ENE0_9CHLO|nr:hypothetical protein CYMTET_54790 [Cymbomonas tetramitiformis]